MRRRLLAASAVVGLVFANALAGAPLGAHAASGDSIDSLDATYTVQRDGSVRVEEKLAYRFGSASHRGITRSVVTREAYSPNKDKDRTYQLKVVSVTASPSVPTNYVVERPESKQGSRSGREVIRVGDKNTPFSDPAVTYTLVYEISRAVISGPGGDELYWDVIAPEFPPVAKASITVNTPSGLREQSCYGGPMGSTEKCPASRTSPQSATYTQTSVGDGKGMTVGAVFEPGAVANNQPQLVDSASLKDKLAIIWGLALAGVSTLASILIGVFWSRSRRDERFLGVAPGTIPADHESAPVGPDTEKEIPVAFVPPNIAPEEAGLVIDGTLDVRDTTACLLELAVRGAITLSNDEGNYTAQLVDPSKAARPHQSELLDNLFGAGAPVGTVADLSQQGSLTAAHAQLLETMKAQLGELGWYKRLPRGTKVPAFSLLGVVGFGAVGFGFFKGISLPLLVLALPLLPLIVLGMVLRRKFTPGQRSAVGRAVTDRIEGFRLYLTTAEADQIKFEEGEDIFSKYLPWATIFGVAERWTKICQQLVDMGRLSDEQPSWYVGYWPGFYAFDVGGMTSSLDTASTPMETSGSSDGSGGFSSGDSGFSGGGGGGGDVGSW